MSILHSVRFIPALASSAAVAIVSAVATATVATVATVMASAPAFASVPKHFVTSEQYFSGLKSFDPASQPPHIVLVSEGLTVATDGARQFMVQDPTGATATVYVVIEGGGSDPADAEAWLQKRGLESEAVAPHFGTGWTTYKVSGSDVEVQKLLSRGVYKNFSLIWVGMSHSSSEFVTRASQYFGRTAVIGNERW